MENEQDEKSAPPPLPPPSGGGGGGPPDKHSASNGKHYSESELSGRKIRRRPRRGATAEEIQDEEESKVEIESLAAASGFGFTSAVNNQTTARNANTNASMSTTTTTTRHNIKPGAYAVDGPDHGSQDSLLRLVGGVNPETSSNNNSNNSNSGNNENIGLPIDENDNAGNACIARNSNGEDGHTIISDSAQSNQASENSAVAEVRAALEAEQDAARAAGMGTRRPSMRSSMRSSITSDIGSSSVADGLGRATSGPISGVGATGSSRSVDLALANHPDIEFLAEATLVVDSANGNDDDQVGRDEYDGGDFDENDPPPDYQVALNDLEEDCTITSEDVSTIGPPPELSSLASRMRLPTRVRNTSHGSSRSRSSNSRAVGIGNASSNGDSRRGRRQRRSDRPTDPYSDLPEASCTSIDESNTASHNRVQSREMLSSFVDNCVNEQARPDTHTNPSLMEIEEGSSAPPTESSVLVAEPLKDKCLLPRRTVVLGIVIGFALMLAVALGVAIPMSMKDDNSFLFPPDGGPSYPVYDFDLADDEVLTTVPEPICFSLLPMMSNVSDICTDPAVDLPKGGPMCQLVADGLLGGSDPAANIDVVLVNAGGFRADILPGDLTVGYIQSMVMPFNNNRVAYLSVTPAEIYDTLNAALFDTGIVITEEQQRRNGENPTVKLTWPFESTYPYAAGLRYDVDLNAPEGQKATNVIIRSKSLSNETVASIEGNAANKTMEAVGDVEDGWMYLDPSDSSTLIRVLSSDFLAGGGDGYFQTVAKERIEIEDALEFNDVFMYYCTLESELIAPHYIDGMSTRNFVPLEGYENDQ